MKRRVHYTQQDKATFFATLEQYRHAIENGTGEEFIRASIAIRWALGGVPKSYKTLVNRVFKETERKNAVRFAETESKES